MSNIQYTEEQIQKIIDLLDLIELKGIRNWGIMNSVIAILDGGKKVLPKGNAKNTVVELAKQDKGEDKKDEVK